MPHSLPRWVWPDQKLLAAKLAVEHPVVEPKPIFAKATIGMMLARIALAWILVIAMGAPAHPDQAGGAYKRGVRAEAKAQYDEAYEAYNEAYRLKPKEPRYAIAYVRVRTLATEEHMRKGQVLRDNLKLQEALAEFQRAAEIDATNYAAQQELQHTVEMIKEQAQQKAEG